MKRKKKMGKGLSEKRVKQVIEILESEYPYAKTALHFTNPLELLVATVLSAQCTDERVNKVTRDLFMKYRSAEDYARADLTELEVQVERLQIEKDEAVKNADYERAADLRDEAQRIIQQKEEKHKKWREATEEVDGVVRRKNPASVYDSMERVCRRRSRS